jgi:hypothetical protein
VDLWGAFPGRLQTTLRNSFSFFGLESLGSDPKSAVNISMTNQSVVVLDQQVAYQKFDFNPKTVRINKIFLGYRGILCQ